MIPTEFGYDLTPTELLSKATAVIDQFQKASFRCDPTTRLVQYRDFLLRITSEEQRGVVLSDSDSRLFPQAVHEVLQFDRIARTLASDPMWRTQIKHLVGGECLAEDDTVAMARSTQFELNLASALVESGVSLTRAEPDIVFNHDGVDVSIAAKKLTSSKQIEKRIREASEQIARQKRDGVIALELTEATFPSDIWLRAPSARLAKPYLTKYFWQHLAPYLPYMPQWVNQTYVVSFMVFMTRPIFVEDTQVWTIVSDVVPITESPDHRGARINYFLLDKLANRL